MIDLSGVFRMTIGYFARPVIIQDTVFTSSGGEDIQALSGATRTVYGAVDSSSRQQMEFLFGGDVSDGDLMLYVSSDVDIYIADQYDTGTSRKQSYIVDNGTTYRVAARSDLSNTCGYYTYLGKRHVQQDVI